MARRKDSGASAPFREGFDARMLNRSIASCPYGNADGAADSWRCGFYAACMHMDGHSEKRFGLTPLGAEPAEK
jgi:hypothetical protein